ncbi:hypothetical protein EJB05_34302, partial [Eragrostis curvula]
MSAPTNPEAGADIAVDLYPFLRKYKDGRIERFAGGSNFVPASEAPARATGVATRDVVIDPVTGVSARLFLSAAALATSRRRTLPLIVYFHGGCFCTGSAFSKMFHRYAESLAARAGALVVSVDYRLAPEHPIPAAYDDAWAAFRWAASLSDPWLACHADPTRVFLAGESAGANIAHNVASRAGSSSSPDAIDIEGLIVLQPFFWGVERLPFETDRRHNDGRHMFSPEKVDTFWPFLTAGLAGNDDSRLNPPAEQVASMPCRRAEFVNKSTTPSRSAADDPAIYEEMCWAALANGSGKRICVSPRSMARQNELVIGPGQASPPRFGLMRRHSRSASKLIRKAPFGPAVLWRSVARA